MRRIQISLRREFITAPRSYLTCLPASIARYCSALPIADRSRFAMPRMRGRDAREICNDGNDEVARSRVLRHGPRSKVTRSRTTRCATIQPYGGHCILSPPPRPALRRRRLRHSRKHRRRGVNETSKIDRKSETYIAGSELANNVLRTIYIIHILFIHTCTLYISLYTETSSYIYIYIYMMYIYVYIYIYLSLSFLLISLCSCENTCLGDLSSSLSYTHFSPLSLSCSRSGQREIEQSRIHLRRQYNNTNTNTNTNTNNNNNLSMRQMRLSRGSAVS